MHARRVEGIVYEWDGVPVDRGSAGRLRDLIERASACGIEMVLSSGAGIDAFESWLPARLVGPGALIMAVNGGSELYELSGAGPQRLLAGTGSPGSVEPGCVDSLAPGELMQWSVDWMWERGVGARQVLFCGAGPGGPSDSPSGDPDRSLDVLGRVLREQLACRSNGELPSALEDPSWTLAIDGIDPRLERAHESLLTLADGRLGTRGSTLAPTPDSDPAVLMSGIYARHGEQSHLLPAPRWNQLTGVPAAATRVRRTLDMHSGVLRQELATGAGITALQFSSLADPGTAVLRAHGELVRRRESMPLVGPARLSPEGGEQDGVTWMRVASAPASIFAAAHERYRAAAPGISLDRIASYEAADHGRADESRALRRVRHARTAGFDALLAAHRQAWASRWRDADIRLDGDPDLQRALRLAMFHLIGSVADTGEAAVGARGLSGQAYKGHVFWDSDVYVLPFLAATHPPAARAMLEYRMRRLPAAKRAAGSLGRNGARFPWEGARSGDDTTPESLRDNGGRMVAVLTGELEEHIVADVAWAAACYIDWTADRAFAQGPGAELLIQTARWWASRIERDEHGRGHIRGVIGPDEYHVGVDDNAFTNVMARWNLRHAAAFVADSITDRERGEWLELADTIVDGYDAQTGIYEQFAGFHRLEPLLIAESAPRRPVAADMLLGHERVANAQVLKQADALMLHYLVPEEVARGSLRANLDFYEPRTAHGSTLSPGVHATLLARAGLLEEALEMLRLTARIDLDDVGGSTAGGLHLASMGSLWRAVTYGFAGLRPAGGELAIDPVLPADWDALEVRVRFRGSRVRVRVSSSGIEAAADPPLMVVGPDGGRTELTRSSRVLPGWNVRSLAT